MILKMETTYSGIELPDAIFTVESITIQSGQLDFFVSTRAKEGSIILTGETYGCSYNEGDGTPYEQAYAHLLTLESFNGASVVS